MTSNSAMDCAEDVRFFAESSRYICVHPLADEHSLLATLGVPPSACIKVDLYWEFQADVAFVQVMTEAYFPTWPCGHYARRNENGYLNLVTIVRESPVDSAILNAVLKQWFQRFVGKGEPTVTGVGPMDGTVVSEAGKPRAIRRKESGSRRPVSLSASLTWIEMGNV